MPSITIYEVFKRIYQQRNEDDAIHFVAQMKQGMVIDTDSNIALEAARISADEKLPMADSLILATARLHQAILWTQDIDLKNFANVRYVAK